MQSLEEEIRQSTREELTRSKRKTTNSGPNGNDSHSKRSTSLRTFTHSTGQPGIVEKKNEKYGKYLERLEDDFKTRKNEYEKHCAVIDQKIQEKTFIHQSKHCCFVSQIELQNILGTEQNTIKDTIERYNERRKVNEIYLDNVTKAIMATKAAMETLEGDIKDLHNEGKRNQSSFQNYTNTYLRLKAIYSGANPIYEDEILPDGVGMTISADNLQKVRSLNKYLEDLSVCKICFSKVAKVYSCKNGHVLCQKCKNKVQSCAFCRDKIIVRSLVLEEILKKQ